MAREIQEGYLLLADLSGFTAFVAGSEIDHAQPILEQILGNLVDSLTPTLRLCEIEGDAVFVYAPRAWVGRGELMAELVEDAYCSFRALRDTMVRNATCPCRACQGISGLELKFVVHAGDFVLQDLTGTPKPVGNAVNMVHRLLKNTVEPDTGWRGYVLYTDEAMKMMGLSPEALRAGSESYAHVGSVTTYSAPLEVAYEAACERNVCRIRPEEAHAVVERVFDAPPSLIWDWLNDMNKRSRWTTNARWSVLERPKERTSADASNHCATHDVIERVLDWRPFDYYTVRLEASPWPVFMTIEMHETDEGTLLRWCIRIDSRLPRWVLTRVARRIVTRIMELEASLEQLADRLAEARPGVTRSVV